MKKCYMSPETEMVKVTNDGICAVITQGSDSDDFAKPNDNEVEEDEEPELAAPIKDKWGDLSEKKIAK